MSTESHRKPWWQLSAIAPPSSKWFGEAGVLCGLLAITAILWCSAWNLWTSTDWGFPTAYLEIRESDTLGMLGTFRAASDGHYIPLLPKKVPELGAPGVADWSSIPTIEEIPIFLTGLAASSLGLFAALNLKLLLGHLLAATCFYLTARWQGASTIWAFTGGLAFGTAPFFFSESPHHSIVVYGWHLPLFIPIWRWLWEGKLTTFFSRRMAFAAGVAFLTGLQNVYYTNIFCQLALLSAVVGSWRMGTPRLMLPLLPVIGSAAAAFVLMSLDSVFKKTGGTVVGVERAYKWLEIYALKPVDLFIPFGDHRHPFFQNLWATYGNSSVLANEGSYLGLAGIFGLLLLLAHAFSSGIKGKWNSFPPEVWQVLYIFSAFVAGGLNSFLGVLGITLFRAGYRMSIVLLAIILMYAVLQASSFFEKKNRSGLWLAAAFILIIAWDQVPLPPHPAQTSEIRSHVTSDRDFVSQLESQLPKDAMVFQLPVMSFPEAPVPGLTPYEHFRPYIHSSKLRFSFGATKAQVENDWMASLRSMDPNTLVQKLSEAGFQAVIVNVKGYPNGGNEAVSKLSAATGTKPIVSADGELQALILP